MRATSISLMIPDCPKCGYPIVVNGFASSILCESCHNKIGIGHREWSSIFREVFRNTGKALHYKTHRFTQRSNGGFDINIEASACTHVGCTQCKNKIEVSGIDDDAPAVFCHSCGNKHPMVPIKGGARAEKAVSVIHHLSTEEDTRLKQVEPIMMSCPNCNAGLKISTENDRITQCAFCNGEFMIPDPLWKRLHPVKTAKGWYVFYDHPPPPTAAELAERKRKRGEADKKKQSQREEANRQKQRQREEAAQRKREKRKKYLRESIKRRSNMISAAKRHFRNKTLIGYGVATVGGIVVVGVTLLFFAPLLHVIGDQICPGGFQVTTSTSGDSSMTHFYCTENGIRESLDLFGWVSIVLGSLTLCGVWTLYSGVRWMRLRETIKKLQFEKFLKEEELEQLNR